MSPNAGPPMLELAAVNAFYGRAHILFDISLTVEAGRVVVLLGRNGAGKSTTLKSIIGLVRPASGAISFAGRRIERTPVHEIARAGVGYVPEERRIFSELTVLENLEVGKLAPRTPRTPRTSGAGATAWSVERVFELFPNLADMRERLGARMSGGEQQMLSIARTLMGNPSCILLDEPSEGLAPVVVEQLIAAVHKLKRAGLCVMLSEQNLHFATAVADRAYIIERGRIAYEGTISELSANESVRSAYLAV